MRLNKSHFSLPNEIIKIHFEQKNEARFKKKCCRSPCFEKTSQGRMGTFRLGKSEGKPLKSTFEPPWLSDSQMSDKKTDRLSQRWGEMRCFRVAWPGSALTHKWRKQHFHREATPYFSVSYARFCVCYRRKMSIIWFGLFYGGNF